MPAIKTRIEKIEMQLKSDADGIHWALEIAKIEAGYEINRMRLIENYNRHAERIGKEKIKSTPRFMILQDIEAHARQLSQKYISREDYELNKPKPVFSGKALEKAKQQYKEKIFSNG